MAIVKVKASRRGGKIVKAHTRTVKGFARKPSRTDDLLEIDRMKGEKMTSESKSLQKAAKLKESVKKSKGKGGPLSSEREKYFSHIAKHLKKYGKSAE